MYTGMWDVGVGGLELSSRDTAESEEDRRTCCDLPGSLALSTSGTLPLLPELVSSESPLSTPSILYSLELFFSPASASMRGSCGGTAATVDLLRPR